MAADARRLAELSMPAELAKEVAAQIDANLPVTEGSIENADIAADADIEFSKLDATTTTAGIEAAVAAKTEIAALSAGPTVTYTSGSAPAVSGALTIANSATPSVTELLDYIVELNAKVSAITAALKA
jgi:hypothetical protein